ncbi:hypothetical protein AB0N28_01825 [Streptomyces sp. NPDC051130]
MHLRYFGRATGFAEPLFAHFEEAVYPWWNQPTQPSEADTTVRAV